MLYITAPIPPSINNDYMKPRTIMSNGKPMTMMYETGEAKKYKKLIETIVKREHKKQGFVTDLTKFVIVEWTFYFPRTNMDTNNYYKCFVDAITNCKDLIWHDDNLTLMRDNRIYYDSVNPHIEVAIYYSDHVGVFENKEDYDLFIANNCSQCKKFKTIGEKGGCSVYKSLMESRINKDVEFGDKITCKIIKRT